MSSMYEAHFHYVPSLGANVFFCKELSQLFPLSPLENYWNEFIARMCRSVVYWSQNPTGEVARTDNWENHTSYTI